MVTHVPDEGTPPHELLPEPGSDHLVTSFHVEGEASLPAFVICREGVRER